MISKTDIEKLELLTRDFLEALEFDFETIEATSIKTETDEGDEVELLKVDIKGENLSYLIGRYGRTMFSLQHLLNMAFNSKREDRVQIIVDVNNYREKREKELKSYAERALVEVKQTNLPMALPPMKPAERRIIHMALKEEQGIVTTSEGEEPNRYVVVKPE